MRMQHIRFGGILQSDVVVVVDPPNEFVYFIQFLLSFDFDSYAQHKKIIRIIIVSRHTTLFYRSIHTIDHQHQHAIIHIIIIVILLHISIPFNSVSIVSCVHCACVCVCVVILTIDCRCVYIVYSSAATRDQQKHWHFCVNISHNKIFYSSQSLFDYFMTFRLSLF